MRISALSAAAGVPVATIKYYLREGLLPQGQTTSPNQARYDRRHVERLRLVRALVEVAGLSIAQVREVVAGLDDPPDSWHDVLGIAHGAAVRASRAMPADPGSDVRQAQRLVDTFGWHVDERTPALAQLERALAALDDVGIHLSAERLAVYADAAHQVAESDVDDVPRTSPAVAARFVVLGTLMLEPLLLALRRLAQEDVSATRFANLRPPSSRPSPPPPDLPEAEAAR